MTSARAKIKLQTSL